MSTLMRELIEEEDEISKFYKELAKHVVLDTELFEFLTEISKDEEGHSKVLWKFDRWIGKLPEAHHYRTFGITLRNITMEDKRRSRQLMEECLERAKNQGLDGRGILEYVAMLEEIEWSDAFIDAINTVLINSIKYGAKEIIPFVSGIEQHRSYIERFMVARDVDHAYIDRLRRIPFLWKEKVLVVDDSESARELLKEILSGNTVVRTAENGVEAMAMLRTNYFAVIISDIHMPVMDGIEFYNSVVEKYPSIGKRFIFFSGECDEYEPFFSARGLPFVSKCSTMKSIVDTVATILDRTRILVQRDM